MENDRDQYDRLVADVRKWADQILFWGIASTLSSLVLGFLIGWNIPKRSPAINGVQTWYEPPYKGSDPSICHNVYPPSGKTWNSTHSVGMQDCPMCEGKPAMEREAREELRKQ